MFTNKSGLGTVGRIVPQKNGLSYIIGYNERVIGAVSSDNPAEQYVLEYYNTKKDQWIKPWMMPRNYHIADINKMIKEGTARFTEYTGNPENNGSAVNNKEVYHA